MLYSVLIQVNCMCPKLDEVFEKYVVNSFPTCGFGMRSLFLSV